MYVPGQPPIAREAGLAITCQRYRPRLDSQRLRPPPGATSMPADRGEWGAGLAGVPRTISRRASIQRGSHVDAARCPLNAANVWAI